jgi:diaminohydroxyphosphoribosylaminopyrimidine deaminase/5-amino-6-(5-phosphoribosylamino)uracil reductase
MRRALALALRGWGRVAPNPMVAAVLVRDGVVVAEGYHGEWGGPHAEVVALDAAGEMARGATLYVVLEPCHHTGKTGPCTRAIADAGVSRVVCGAVEVNSDAGGGAAWMRDQGIEVEMGVCEQEAHDLNAVHHHAHRASRPFVALKYALSLDARLSEGPGTSTRLTQGEAVAEAHRLRAGHDAIMIGIGTALADDPLLTIREWSVPRVAPARIVLDSSLRLPPGSQLVQTARDVPLWVFAGYGASADRAAELEAKGAEVIRVSQDTDTEGLALGAVLAALWKRKVRAVLCEGGGRLGSALLAGGHVDRLYAFVAPLHLGEPGVAAFQGGRQGSPREWRLLERRELGEVTLLALAPRAPKA